MPVVLGAANLVDRLAAELDHVKWIKHDLGVREAVVGVANRPLIAGGHVDRDRLDRGLLLACEPVEERLQAGGVAALGGPHDAAPLVVGDAGQELVIGAVADLVHADEHERVQPAGGQLLSHDPRDDLADRLPADSHQPGELRLAHLLRQPRVGVEPGRVATLSGDCFPDPLPRTGRARSRASGSPRAHSVVAHGVRLPSVWPTARGSGRPGIGTG